MSAASAPTLSFQIELSTPCALNSVGRWVALWMLASGVLLSTAAAVFMGAWPVLLWSIIELLALVVAFRVVARRSAAREWVRLDNDDLVVIRDSGEGSQGQVEWRFNRHWAVLHVLEKGDCRDVAVRYCGRRYPLGRYVSDERREALVESLAGHMRVVREMAT